MTIATLDEQIMDEIMEAQQSAMKAQGWPRRPATLESGATASQIALAIGAPYKEVWRAIRGEGGLEERRLVTAVGARASGGRPEIMWGMVRTRRAA